MLGVDACLSGTESRIANRIARQTVQCPVFTFDGKSTPHCNNLPARGSGKMLLRLGQRLALLLFVNDCIAAEHGICPMPGNLHRYRLGNASRDPA